MNINKIKKIKFEYRNMTVYSKAGYGKLLETELKYGEHPELRIKVIEMITSFAKEFPSTFCNYCSRCGNCCKREDIYIKGGELFNIGNFLNVNEEEFHKKYLSPSMGLSPYDGFIRLKDGKCPFLERKSTGRYICTIHENRPEGCRQYMPLSTLCKKEIYDMIEEISCLEVTGEKIFVKLRSKENYQYHINDKFKEKYSEVIKVLSSIDTDNILNKLKFLLDDLEEGKISRLELREHKNDLKKFVNELQEEENFPGEEIEEIWDRISNLEKEGRDKEITPGDSSPQEEFYLLSIENFSLKRVIFYEMDMNLSYRVGEEEYDYFMKYSEDSNILSSARACAITITHIIRKNFPRSLDNLLSLCYMCGYCCNAFQVEIEPSDIRRLAEEFKKTEEDFRKEYTKPPGYSWNPGSATLKSIDGDRGACIFLKENDSGHYYCSVHHVKPELCKIYRTGKPHCYKEFSSKDYYRLLSNIKSIDLDNHIINIITDRTFFGLSINWRNYESLKEEIEKFLFNLEKLIIKNYFPHLQKEKI